MPNDYTAKQIPEMEGFYKGLFLKARDEIGASSFGLAIVDLERDSDDHPMHAHPGGQEEVYLVLRGSGTLEFADGESIALDGDTVVRVGPETERRIVPGPDGIRLAAIGGTPGQAYEAPGYSAVGAPDPAA